VGGRAARWRAVTVANMRILYPFSSKVVGISQYQTAASGCLVGMEIGVAHEPDNPYDPNACKVTCKGETIGYLPKTLAARLVSQGGRLWRGEVSVRHDSKATIGLEVKILESAEDETGGPTGEQGDRPQTDIRRIVVVKRSGRALGKLVRIERAERRVIVATAAGEIPYPDGLVEIVDPA